MELNERIFVNLSMASWQEAKGKLFSWLAISDLSDVEDDGPDEKREKHKEFVERCVMSFIEAIENNKELKIVDDSVEEEDNYHGC